MYPLLPHTSPLRLLNSPLPSPQLSNLSTHLCHVNPPQPSRPLTSPLQFCLGSTLSPLILPPSPQHSSLSDLSDFSPRLCYVSFQTHHSDRLCHLAGHLAPRLSPPPLLTPTPSHPSVLSPHLLLRLSLRLSSHTVSCVAFQINSPSAANLNSYTKELACPTSRSTIPLSFRPSFLTTSLIPPVASHFASYLGSQFTCGIKAGIKDPKLRCAAHGAVE
jgi:hypothetical protein